MCLLLNETDKHAFDAGEYREVIRGLNKHKNREYTRFGVRQPTGRTCD